MNLLLGHKLGAGMTDISLKKKYLAVFGYEKTASLC